MVVAAEAWTVLGQGTHRLHRLVGQQVGDTGYPRGLFIELSKHDGQFLRFFKDDLSLPEKTKETREKI